MFKFSFSFVALLGCVSCALSTSAHAGGIVFVGDSITQGGNFTQGGVPSYRYSLFKNYVDNNVAYDPMGTTHGARSGEDVSGATPDYRGYHFDNVSESGSSARSYNLGGNPSEGGYKANPGTVSPAENAGPVSVKLGLDNPYTGEKDTYYNGNTLTTYTGETYQSLYGDKKADTVCIMIGVNDIADGRSAESIVNNVHDIVQSYQQYNPHVKVVLGGVLPVQKGNVSYAHVNAYNEVLKQAVKEWSTESSVVQYADVSKGFYAYDAGKMTDNPGVHPNKQGELIIAGNWARALGIGQRTVGLERQGASALVSQADLSSISPKVYTRNSSGVVVEDGSFTGASAGAGWSALEGKLVINSQVGTTASQLKKSWGGEGALHNSSLSFSLKMLESETPDKNKITIYSGNGLDKAGILSISENGVFWGSTLLYGASNAAGAEATGTEGFFSAGFHDFRLVYKMSEEGAEGFYYLWMDDQLIGEDLAGSTNNLYKDMILLGKNSVNDVTMAEIGSISYSANTAYAPSIPEPSTATLGLLGLAGLLMRRRRFI